MKMKLEHLVCKIGLLLKDNINIRMMIIDHKIDMINMQIIDNHLFILNIKLILNLKIKILVTIKMINNNPILKTILKLLKIINNFLNTNNKLKTF